MPKRVRDVLGKPVISAHNGEKLGTVADLLLDDTSHALLGVVVTHGTDALEETAYLLARSIAGDKPVVVTGAMRTSSDLGWDGPANLGGAVRVAAKLKFTPAHSTPNQTGGCGGDNEQGDKLLPIHCSEDSRGAPKRKRNLRKWRRASADACACGWGR